MSITKYQVSFHWNYFPLASNKNAENNPDEESVIEPNSEENLDAVSRDPDSSNDSIASTESRNERYLTILIFCEERSGSIKQSNM